MQKGIAQRPKSLEEQSRLATGMDSNPKGLRGRGALPGVYSLLCGFPFCLAFEKMHALFCFKINVFPHNS